jgi:hypothetical protein
MAKAMAFVGGMACGFLLATGILVSHADDVQAEVSEAATAAHVDPVKLQGAVNSLKTAGVPDTDPFSYLRSTGELPPIARPPATSTASPPVLPAVSVWQRLANCESNGDWHANTGNSYFGGLQEDLVFWRRYGGLAYAPRPDLASAAAQMTVAQRGSAAQGFLHAWPSCSRRLGLR